LTRRYFNAVRVRNDKGVGVGIQRHSNGETIEIASMFYPELSHKESIEVIATYVRNRLCAGESAKILTGGVSLRRKYCEVNSNMRFYSVKPTVPSMEEAQLLANDALKRRDTIIEDLRG
jgi:hypothetical protein